MDVIEKVKEYCERELYFYQSYGKEKGANLWSLIDRCYGAIMFEDMYYTVLNDLPILKNELNNLNELLSK